MKKLYLKEVEQLSAQFTACEQLEDLDALGFDSNKLKLLSLNPSYHVFKVPKANGKTRLIEAPDETLKGEQRKLSKWLQCVYFINQTSPSYGYIIRVKDVLPVKNILEHARQHLGAIYLLNIDFQDFFHQIGQKRIFQIFQQSPFSWSKKASATLAKLCSRNGRLPMGAPTSPVLSNFASIQLDQELKGWAESNNFVFTRFVDDLSFSSKKQMITLAHLDEIKKICNKYQYQINPHKVKWYPPESIKEVTGLILNDTVDIDPKFYEALNHNLKRLQGLSEVNMILNQHRENELYRAFKKEVQGMVNFIGMIEGYGSQLFFDYRQKLKQALQITEESLSARWTNSNYF